jgi:putative hydrolase of the HAD superfamily
MILRGLEVPEEPVTIAELTSQFEDTILVNPPGLLDNAAGVLESLSRHCLLGLVCDTGLTPGRVLRKVLEQHDVLRFFTSTTFSDEIGVTKPEIVVFNRTLERLGVEPATAAHIGDLLDTDIAGAKAAGLDAIWINRDGGPVDLKKTAHLPDWQIKDLKELLTLIPK